ncbi:hypothetical protein [Neomicrococcus lactis]|uniref:Uncharacterized protein n=1 Tax=Neomicrococcus lactis TaxID=732241 RepID=A0A7W9DA05_9MICC|nr:hypothetical protein [Neomicrococcus lactis]MBB5597123.1 hypothetical protein [Neomicrococcus lactis]
MADQAPLKINYGRLAVAVVGLIAFVTMLIAAVMALAGQGTGRLASTMLVVVIASFIGLRALALRARQRRAMERVQAAFADAMNPQLDSFEETESRPQLAIASVYAGPSRPFDALATDESAVSTAVAVKDSATEAVSSSSEISATEPATLAQGAGEEWKPVELPKPLYTEAPVVKREVAEPLAKPEEKKATPGAPSIRQSEDLARVVHRAATGALIQGYAESLDTGRIDLDMVLRRRRA